jgi:hypothetical protein
MNWAGLESGNVYLQKYSCMQDIKGTSTLRISRKNKKPVPRIVFRFGRQGRQVKKFFETRKFILNFLKRLQKKQR